MSNQQGRPSIMRPMLKGPPPSGAFGGPQSNGLAPPGMAGPPRPHHQMQPPAQGFPRGPGPGNAWQGGGLRPPYSHPYAGPGMQPAGGPTPPPQPAFHHQAQGLRPPMQQGPHQAHLPMRPMVSTQTRIGAAQQAQQQQQQQGPGMLSHLHPQMQPRPPHLPQPTGYGAAPVRPGLAGPQVPGARPGMPPQHALTPVSQQAGPRPFHPHDGPRPPTHQMQQPSQGSGMQMQRLPGPQGPLQQGPRPPHIGQSMPRPVAPHAHSRPNQPSHPHTMTPRPMLAHQHPQQRPTTAPAPHANPSQQSHLPLTQITGVKRPLSSDQQPQSQGTDSNGHTATQVAPNGPGVDSNQRRSGVMRPTKGPPAFSHSAGGPSGFRQPGQHVNTYGSLPPGAHGPGPRPAVQHPQQVQHAAGAGPQTSPRPVKKTRREREFDAAAAAALTAPVVVRQPASDAERREVDKWKEERRRGYPTSANLQRKVDEEKQRAESGALDPKRQERLARLREVLALQRSMGVDHIAGTTDLRVDSLVGRGGGSHQGGANGPTGQQTHNDPSSDPPRQVAGGVATKYQWVRNGYVPPAAGAVGAAGPAAQGAEAAAGPRAGLQRQGAGTGAQVQTQAQGRPRAPSLLHRLLDKEVRRDHSWLLQAIRFFTRNNFLQPRAPTNPAPTTDAPIAADGSETAPHAAATGSHDSQAVAAATAADGSGRPASGAAAAASHSHIDWPPELDTANADLSSVLPPVAEVDSDEDLDLNLNSKHEPAPARADAAMRDAEDSSGVSRDSDGGESEDEGGEALAGQQVKQVCVVREGQDTHQDLLLANGGDLDVGEGDCALLGDAEEEDLLQYAEEAGGAG